MSIRADREVHRPDSFAFSGSLYRRDPAARFVNLKSHVLVARRPEDRREIQIGGLPPTGRGRVADDVDILVVDGSEQPLCHFGPVHPETGMDACDHQIEVPEQGAREIQGPVLIYVAFYSLKDPDAPGLRLDSSISLLCCTIFSSQSPVDLGTPRMIADSKVHRYPRAFAAAAMSRIESLPSLPERMNMQVSFHPVIRHESGGAFPSPQPRSPRCSPRLGRIREAEHRRSSLVDPGQVSPGRFLFHPVPLRLQP